MRKVFALFLALAMGVMAWSQTTVHVGDLLCTDSTIVTASQFPTSGKTAKGVVFYVDNSGQHGYACALVDLPERYSWTTGSSPDITAITNRTDALAAMEDFSGQSNTDAIIAYDSTKVNTAAYKAKAYGEGWFLPSIGQLRILYTFHALLEPTFTMLYAEGIDSQMMTGDKYWSSSETMSPSYAYYVGANGAISNSVKATSYYYVRPICAF